VEAMMNMFQNISTNTNEKGLNMPSLLAIGTTMKLYIILWMLHVEEHNIFIGDEDPNGEDDESKP
jgi:hypothetical protein